jgi:hypothetical protein
MFVYSKDKVGHIFKLLTIKMYVGVEMKFRLCLISVLDYNTLETIE